VPIGLVHSLSTSTPDYVIGALLLMVAGMVVLAVGLVRYRRAFLNRVSAVVFVELSAFAMWPLSEPTVPALFRWVAMALAAGALVTYILQNRNDATEPGDEPGRDGRIPLIYAGTAIILAAVLLFHDLGGYSGPLVLTWESPVLTDGFAKAFNAGENPLSYTAKRLLWDDGILSAGHTSLFFGAPAYALMTTTGFSPWNMRVSAVLATLISIYVVYRFSRRFFGPTVAGALAVLLGLNVCILYYGRYGSSPAGTVLATLLALWTVWIFLDAREPRWWMAPVCALSLYVATLQYSPARLVVLIFLGFLFAVAAIQWKQLRGPRIAGLAVIALAAFVVWQVEGHFNAQSSLLAARGEQYFSFLKQPENVDSLFGRRMLSRPMRADEMKLEDKIELLIQVVRTTIPQYLSVVGPSLRPTAHGAVVGDDPPRLQLYFAPVVLFIAWGLAHSLRRVRSWKHLSLLAWVVGATVPLLLTNRVDSHRAVLLTIPLMIWAALGIWEAARVMRAAGVSPAIQHVFAVSLALTLVYSNINILYYTQVPQAEAGKTLDEVALAEPGPIAVGALMNHREVAWADFALLERQRQDPNKRHQILSEGVRNTLSDDNPTAEGYARQMLRLLENTTLFLAPAERFRRAAGGFRAEGARVAEVGTPAFRILRVDAGEAATGVSDSRLSAAQAAAASPASLRLDDGPQVSLSELTPFDVEYGFSAPRIDKAWEDSPILMGTVRYERGIGVHAWARLRYTVPEGARALQSVIGLQDDVRGCAVASVTFEVRDEQGQILFNSGLVTNNNPVRAMQADLRGAQTITLEVTEGGNGRDCDHGNWALPSFLLSTPALNSVDNAE